MTDNANDKLQGSEGVQSQGDKTGQSQGDSKTISLADALAKIDALEKDNATYRRKQRENESASVKAEETRLAQQQEWQKLAENRKAELDKLLPIAEQHEAITAAFNASLDNRLKQIPDDVRKKTVDPIRKALSPVDFSNWLDANTDILRARQAPNLDGGAGGSNRPANGATDMTQADIDMAAAMNIKPEVWAKRKAEIAALKTNPRKE